MKRQQKRGFLKSGISLMLSILMILTVFQGFQSKASGGVDLTSSSTFHHMIEKFQVKNYNNPEFSDIIKDGKNVMASDQKIYKEDTARIFYKFSINSQVNVGDYFYVNLPSGNIFKGAEQINKPLMDGSKKIGEISTTNNNKLKVVFTKEGSGIRDGFLYAGGTFVGEGNNVDVPLPGKTGEKVTLTVEKRPGSEAQLFSPGKYPRQSKQSPMSKYGVYQYTVDSTNPKNYFAYNLDVNKDEESKLFKDKISKKDRINKRENVIIVDELPDGQTFYRSDRNGDEEIRLSVKLKAPAYQNEMITEDDMSDIGVLNSDFFRFKKAGPDSVSTSNGKVFFDIIREDSNSKTLETFHNEIKAAGKRTIGIYKNKVMIVNVGSLPMSDLTYGDLFGGEDKLQAKITEKLTSKNISKEQKDRMITAYGNQPVVGFTFEYRTFLDGSNSEDVYVNKALFQYDKNKTFVAKRDTAYDWLKGGGTLLPSNGELKVTKKWFGTVPTPPQGIQVQLYDATDNQDIGSPGTLDATNSWTYTFSGLEKYKDPEHKEIKYKVKEVNLPSGYRNSIKKTADGFEITNIEQVTFKVNKEWKHADTSPLTPSPSLPIKVGLYREGRSIPVEIITLNGNAGQFKPVDKADKNGSVNYSIKEENLPEGFAANYVLSGNIFTLTNTQNPSAKRNIKVRKFWKDRTGAYEDGAGKPDVKINLVKKGSDAIVQTKTLNAGNNWKDTFDDVSVFDGNHYIEYQVVEETVLPGYKPAVIEGNMDDGFQITNQEESMEIKVSKLWEKANGEKLTGADMPDVTIVLKKNGEDYKEETVSLMNNWFNAFTGLPIKENGNPVTYTVEEKVQVPGFQKGVVTSEPGETNSYLVTNKEEVREDITVKKVWKNVEGNPFTEEEASHLPNVEIKIYRGDDLTNAVGTLTLKKENSWTDKFTNLPKFKEDNKTNPIEYVVKETPIGGYSVDEYSKTVTSDVKEVTFTNTQEKRDSLTIEKVWKNAENNDFSDAEKNGLPEVTIALYESETPTKVIRTEKLNKGNGWKYTFNNLPKYNLEGTGELTYKVREFFVSDYEVPKYNYSDVSKIVITNKKLPPIEKISPITVSKEWKNIEGQAFTAEEVANLPEVEVKIYKKTHLDTAVDTLILNRANSWKGEFTNLPKYEADRVTLIHYVIKETPVTGYISDAVAKEVSDSNKVNFINTQEKTSLTVEKSWKKADGGDFTEEEKQSLPEVMIELYENDSPDKILKTERLTKDNSWKHTFENLPKYSLKGDKVLKYKVKEVAVSGYENPIYDGSNPSKIIITNKKLPTNETYIPPVVETPAPEEPKKEEPKKDEEPKKEEPKKDEEPERPEPMIPIPEIPILIIQEDEIPTTIPSIENTTPKNTVPKTPSTVPIIKEEIPELELDGDEIPLGNTEIEGNRGGHIEKGTRKLKLKKELARTGGMETIFLPVLGINVLLIFLLGFVQFLKKKN